MGARRKGVSGRGWGKADLEVYIKDIKSSNGTFINGDRLSPEGIESEPCELKSEDLVVCLCPDLLDPVSR